MNPSQSAARRSVWRHGLLLVVLALIVLTLWVVPAQMQERTPDSSVALPVCGYPRFQPRAAELGRLVTWRPLSQEALRAQGKVDSEGNVLPDMVGDPLSFWAYNFVSDTEYQITATCEVTSTHAYLYLEDGTDVATQVLSDVVNEFETNIYPTDRATFGYDPNPGVDGDPHVYLLLLDIQDDFSGSGAYIAGYFDPLNQYYNGSLPPEYAGWHSNEKEMLYIDVDPADPASDDCYATVAHEFQHMIHWWMDWDRDEETWVDEGCADLAGYVCGYGHPRSHLWTSYPSSNPGFLQEPDHQLTLTGTDWDYEPHFLASYGAAYMWTLYLWEHYGGDDTILALVDEEANGIEGVNNALATALQTDDFQAAFRKWVVANYLDDGTGPNGYDSIELLASGTPNFATSFPRPVLAATHGGSATSQSASVEPWAADAIKFTGLYGRDLQLGFNGADDDSFAAYVITSTSASLAPGSNTISELTLDPTWLGSALVPGAGTQAVLLVPASLTEAGSHGYSYSTVLSGTVHAYLPLVMRPPVGIKGRVTYGGAPASGLELDLIHWDAYGEHTQATLNTAADGSYYFTDVPPLPSDQDYYHVLYYNSPSSPNPGAGRLSWWQGNLIETYTGVADVAGGNFDVSDIPLVAPADGAGLSLPITFRWTRRAITSDSYEVMVYNDNRGEYGWTYPLGYVSSVTIGILPDGWLSGDQYLWWVNVYKSGAPPVNFGSSYGDRTLRIYFSATAQGSQEGIQLQVLPDPQDVRPEWRARVESQQP